MPAAALVSAPTGALVVAVALEALGTQMRRRPHVPSDEAIALAKALISEAVPPDASLAQIWLHYLVIVDGNLTRATDLAQRITVIIAATPDQTRWGPDQ